MAFVELGCEADVHSALRLHHSQLGGRRINVERTVGGGGSGESRQAKIKELRTKQGTQTLQAARELCEAILPAAGAASGSGGAAEDDEEEGEGGVADGATMADVDERFIEFLSGVEPKVAEAVLREAKAIDMSGRAAG